MLLLPLFTQGCKDNTRANAGSGLDKAVSPEWSVELLATIPGFDVPECTLFDADGGGVYVSNIESGPDAYWNDDGKSYLSKIGEERGDGVFAGQRDIIHAPLTITPHKRRQAILW